MLQLLRLVGLTDCGLSHNNCKIIAANLLILALFQPSPSGAYPQKGGETRVNITCSEFSPRVLNLAPFVINDTSFRQTLAPISARKLTSTYQLAPLMERLRTFRKPVRGFHEKEVVSSVLSIIDFTIRSAEMPNRFRQDISALSRLILNQSADWRKLRRELLLVYDQATSFPKFNSYIQLASGVRYLRLPKTAKELLSIAHDRKEPLAVFAQARILEVLEAQITSGARPSLRTSGMSILHRNRVFQELLYLGFSCRTARSQANQIPKTIVASDTLLSKAGATSFTYFNEGGSFEIPYPDNFVFRPTMFYAADNPLDPDTVIDLKRKYRGRYRVTDFAVGKFDNIYMQLTNPLFSTPALNLVRSFPERKFTFEYSPVVASLFGITDMPTYIRKSMGDQVINRDNISFIKNTSNDLTPGPWTRDLWLSAQSHDEVTQLRLKEAVPGLKLTDDFTPVNFSTEGGGHFPIGKYHFLNQQLWQAKLPAQTPEAVLEFGKFYHEQIGRESVLLNMGSDKSSYDGHVDVYLIFLPQPDGKPVIGVADFKLGKKILSNQQNGGVLRGLFLTQQLNARLPIMERAQVNSNYPSMSGSPRFSSLLPYQFNRDHFVTRATSYFSQGPLDAEAEWLKSQGFTVFRFPTALDLSPANGITEVSEEGASFTTVSWGIDALDRELARLISQFGYSLRLVPGNSGVLDGAGYHCLTNEARFE